MGLLNFSLSNLYSKAKNIASELYSGVKYGSNLLSQAKNFVSDSLDKLSSLPYIGNELKAIANKAAEEPFFFGVSAKDIGRGIDALQSWVNSPYITEGAMKFDSLVTPALSQADRAISQFAG
jgi:hypothetical protein